jgi:hypothetical protein
MNLIIKSNILKLSLLGTVLVTSLTAFSQIGNDKLNVTMELTLPSGRANPAFRAYMNGLVNVQPKLQYKFAKDWFVAFGPKYSYFTISEFKIPDPYKTRGGAHTYGGFVEAGWAKWQSPRFGIEFGVKTGVAQTAFVTGLTRESGIQYVTAMYVEPTFSLVLAADEAVAYRWIVGYNISGYNFQPYHIGLGTMGGYSSDDLNTMTQSLIVGFGMSYYFKNQRSDVFIDTGLEP